MSDTRRCRICRVEKSVDDLDSKGRCKGCADAQAALDSGMTCGKFIGARFAAEQKKEEKHNQLSDFYKKRPEKQEYCLNCAGVIPTGSQYNRFCCRDCKAAWEEKQKDTEKRGIWKPKRDQRKDKEDKFCLRCEKKLEGHQKKFCSDECRYLYNLPLVEIDDEDPPEIKKCEFCGSPILDSRKNKYCCAECQKMAINKRRREKRNAGKENG